MCGVDDCRSSIAEVFVDGMMAKVRGHVAINIVLANGAEQAISGARAHGDTFNTTVGIPGGAHTPHGFGESVGDTLGKFAETTGFRKAPDAADTGLLRWGG